MTHRGPFQPLPFCDSVKTEEEVKSLKMRNLTDDRSGGTWGKHLIKPPVAGQFQLNPNHL